MGEMGRFFKAEAIADHGDIPVGEFQQGLRFGKHAVSNMFGCGLASDLLNGTVEVVDVNGEVSGIVAGGAKIELLGGGFYGELAFQQFGEDGGNPGIGVRVTV